MRDRKERSRAGRRFPFCWHPFALFRFSTGCIFLSLFVHFFVFVGIWNYAEYGKYATFFLLYLDNMKNHLSSLPFFFYFFCAFISAKHSADTSGFFSLFFPLIQSGTRIIHLYRQVRSYSASRCFFLFWLFLSNLKKVGVRMHGM